MRRYEIMFIVDPSLPEEEIDQLNSEVESLVKGGGGEVESIEKMGRRKLAYEVERRTDGFYVLFTVAADGEIIKEVERRFRVMDQVLRYLTVRVDLDEKRLDKLRRARQKKEKEDGPDSAPEPVAAASGDDTSGS
jgi:small subunit ribosomal protein S6